MKRREKEAIINKLLLVTLLTVAASILLSMIYSGYTNTRYILAMPKLMIAMGIIGTAGALWVGIKAYREKSLKGRHLTLLLIAIVVAVSSAAIYNYNIYAIYALYILIAIYLIITFAYNIYKIKTK